MDFLARLGSVSGILCGLFIAVPGAIEAFTGETALTSLVLGVSPALAMPLITALFLGQRDSGLSRIGYAVNLLGLGLFGGAAFALNIVLFFVDDAVAKNLASPTRAVLLGSVLLFVLGTVLFGVSMLRSRAYPWVPVWAYLVVFPVFAFASRLPDSALTSGLHIIVGGALIWLARVVWVRAEIEQRGLRF